jgi:hypothetical protein
MARGGCLGGPSFLIKTDYLMLIMAILAFARKSQRSYGVWACCLVYLAIRLWQIHKAKRK